MLWEPIVYVLEGLWYLPHIHHKEFSLLVVKLCILFCEWYAKIVDQDGKFPYNKFCKYLCKVSFICYDNYHEEKKSHIEMLAFLLERMELSAGFNTLESKVQLQLNAKLKLSSDVIQQVPRIINNVELKHN